MRANKLGAIEPGNRQVGSRADRERTGRARLAQDVRWNSETVAKSMIAASRQDLLMAAFEADQRSEIYPAKSHVRAPAREMHGIVVSITACHQLAHPAVRIIVDPDETAAACEAGMIEQREMMEAELESSLGKQRAELREVLAGLRGFSEAVA